LRDFAQPVLARVAGRNPRKPQLAQAMRAAFSHRTTTDNQELHGIASCSLV